MSKHSTTNPAKIDVLLKDRTKQPTETLDAKPEVANALEGLEPEMRSELTQIVKTAVREESFSGPIPHPDILRGYEGITAGFAERIVRMAEKEQDHRFNCENHQMECDKAIIANAANESKRGQNYAFIIAILFLIGAVVLGLLGHDDLAKILGGGTLVSIVSVLVIERVSIFFTGRKEKPKNPQESES